MRIRLTNVNDFGEWRAIARALLLLGTPPEDVAWADPAEPLDLLAPADPFAPRPVLDRAAGRVPPRFVQLAQAAICHRDLERFALLYRLLWHIQKDRTLMSNLDDTDVAKLNRRVEAVLGEYQRMKRELRFRRAVAGDGHKGLVAWFAPRHYVLERVAPHFTRAVAHEDWVIMTPYRSAFWDQRGLTFGRGAGVGSRDR